MKNSGLWMLAIAAMSWTGCNSEASETTGPIPPSNNTNTVSPNTPPNQQAPSQVAVPPQQVPSPAAAAGLNPPHGQPGHRCDIEVGKPLDSKPIQATIPGNQQQQTTIASPQKANPATGPGLNPPHGQPGHRCDLAVGAPLK